MEARHVVDSTADGLSEIRSFPVTGDAVNVECGLQELLEHVLFPMLLGHGLRDMPQEPSRLYGAVDGDDRPARQASQARISYATDPSAQLAVALGRIPGFGRGEIPFDGAATGDGGFGLPPRSTSWSTRSGRRRGWRPRQRCTRR
ncbi:hypothetical protein [Streptomyces sp. NPDC055287]